MYRRTDVSVLIGSGPPLRISIGTVQVRTAVYEVFVRIIDHHHGRTTEAFSFFFIGTNYAMQYNKLHYSLENVKYISKR